MEGDTVELELSHIRKQYGKNYALDDVTIPFTENIFGILGANGAGKSTLFKILTGNISKYSGDIYLDGEKTDVRKEAFRQNLGYMPQEVVGYPWMKVQDFLEYFAVLKGMPVRKKSTQLEIDRILEKTNLKEHRYKRFSELSGGMKRRVLFAQALLADPRILILDEPTAGLDPKERISMRNMIAEESKGRIILLATHIVSDIECIAYQVVLLKKGKLLGCKKPQEWLEELHGHVYELMCGYNEMEDLQKRYRISNIRQEMNGLAMRVVTDEKLSGKNISMVEPTIEDVYIYYLEK